MDKADKKTPMGRGGSPWQNRIVGEGVKPASQFMANEKNWRVHPQAQRDALHGALNEVGWVAPVIENVRTGCLVDGHERVWQALQNGDADVPYVQVDLSPEEEAYVLATLDPIGAMAQADTQKLDELLREVQSGEAGVQQMLDDLAYKVGIVPPQTPEELWQGMPEFEQENTFGAVHSIKVHFASVEDMEAFAALVGQTVTDKTTFIWYPKKERANLKAYSVQDES
jgi:hypothetical protein